MLFLNLSLELFVKVVQIVGTAVFIVGGLMAWCASSDQFQTSGVTELIRHHADDPIDRAFPAVFVFVGLGVCSIFSGCGIGRGWAWLWTQSSGILTG